MFPCTENTPLKKACAAFRAGVAISGTISGRRNRKDAQRHSAVHWQNRDSGNAGPNIGGCTLRLRDSRQRTERSALNALHRLFLPAQANHERSLIPGFQSDCRCPPADFWKSVKPWSDFSALFQSLNIPPTRESSFPHAPRRTPGRGSSGPAPPPR